MNLRTYIRLLLNEEVHAFHGYKFGPDRMGLRGPQFSDEDKVTDEDIESAIDWLESEDPDELVAFSRGAAVLDQMVFDEPGTIDELPPVTYVSPAALRKWTNAPVPKLPAGSRVVHSDGDNIVPLKHACAVADNAGAELGIAKGKGDGKDHVRALSKRNNPDYMLDPRKCLDSDLPDWGADGDSSEEELDTQMKISRELGLKEEDIRGFVRNVLSESVTFREVESPLKYATAGRRRRLALCDSSVADPPHKSDAYFAEIEKWRRYTKGRARKRLKKPVLEEIIPGVHDVCIIGFLDFQQWTTTSKGKPYWYIDYMKVRGDKRGQKISSRLIEEFFERYAEPGSVVDFGKMMQEQIGHLKRKMEKKYPEVTVTGRVWY